MSRIPKIGFGTSTGVRTTQENKTESTWKKTSGSNIMSKTTQENKTESTWKKTSGSNIMSGFKRPSEENLAAVTKRQKNGIQPSTMKKKVFGAILPSNSQNKLAAVEKSKRVVLEPIPDTGIRNSMPAVVSSARVGVPGKTKRPAWDLKGRVQDMEENFLATQQRNANLKQELEAYNERIAALETANTLLHQDVEIKSVQSEEASSEIHRLENLLKQKREECETLANEKEAENQKLNKEVQSLSKQLSTLKDEYDNLKNTYQHEVNGLKSSISSLTCMKSGIQAQLEATELMLTNANTEIQQLKSLCSKKDSQNESLTQQCSAIEAKLREEESLRRKLHNVIQELKGNIRVFCRQRPPLPEELKNGMCLANIVAINDKTIEIQQLNDVGLNESGGKMQPKYEFAFDCYFSPSSSQEQVFTEISQLVQSALDGYNVCIFAYGQTGSGKSFTMEGPANIIDFVANKNHSDLGMIPRSVHQIFSSIQDLEPKGWKYKVETLFLEIYNERIQDLLNTNSGNAKCEIIKSGSKGTDCVISNVNPSEVASAEDVYELMKKARINRAVAATKCNNYSSRSHYLFQMKIYGENSITGEKCDGILNLVDLAGSERVKESESVGDRLTEAKAINKSLSNLGKVIMSLSRKESHIPYRDSKLTHLLANSLGGNSKTLMFVNISPDNKSLSETVNSLRFATKVNQCNIGTAQKRVK